jgi:hypothetical protein
MRAGPAICCAILLAGACSGPVCAKASRASHRPFFDRQVAMASTDRAPAAGHGTEGGKDTQAPEIAPPPAAGKNPHAIAPASGRAPGP